jgi:hypothetical protein
MAELRVDEFGMNFHPIFSAIQEMEFICVTLQDFLNLMGWYFILHEYEIQGMILLLQFVPTRLEQIKWFNLSFDWALTIWRYHYMLASQFDPIFPVCRYCNSNIMQFCRDNFMYNRNTASSISTITSNQGMSPPYP